MKHGQALGLALLLGLAVSGAAGVASAKETQRAHGDHGSDAGHGDAGHGDAGHGDAGHGDAGHGDAHGEHAAPTVADINWAYGFLGEKEGVEPSLLWRSPGTPVPLGALLLNTAILFYLLGRFGGPAIKAGLVSRKQRIAGDIEAAGRMQDEAKDQLAHYEQKLAHMSAETERVLAEVRAAAKEEHERIVVEVKARARALEEEARQIIEHERAHARQAAIELLVARAVEGAREEIMRNLRSDDQERLAQALRENVEGQLGTALLAPLRSAERGVQS